MPKDTFKYGAEIQGSSNRVFGFVFCAVFAVVALYPMMRGGTPRIWSLIVAGIFLLLAIVAPSVLASANRFWMKFGELLHRFVSPVALGIVFCLGVMPTGMLIRLFGKDPLRLRFDPKADSYWIKRNPPGPTADSLNNQF
jgi:hypothetical protein